MCITLAVLVLYELMNPILCKLKAGLQFEMPLGQFYLSAHWSDKREVPHTRVSQPQNASMHDPRGAEKPFPTVKGKFLFMKKNLPRVPGWQAVCPSAATRGWRSKPLANSTVQQKTECELHM